MKYQISIGGLVLLASLAAHTQVASHAPTVFRAPNTNAAAPADPATMNRPVARVNGSVLTEIDLTREEYTIFPYARQHGGLPKDLATQIRSGAMKMIVFEELVYQEALRRKMAVAPAKMQRAEADFHKQFATPEEFNALLQTEFHGSQQLLEDKIRRSLLIDALLRSEVENKCSVTPAEVRAFYDKSATRFQHPESYTFQTISILPPEHATADQLKEGRARAERALHEAKTAQTSVKFGLLAEKLSDDDYRVVMGQHKPVAVDQIAPPVMQAIRRMKLGAISDLIQLDQAYTILHLQAHTPAGKAKFEEVKTQLTKELQETKRNQLRSALDDRLRKDAKIETM